MALARQRTNYHSLAISLQTICIEKTIKNYSVCAYFSNNDCFNWPCSAPSGYSIQVVYTSINFLINSSNTFSLLLLLLSPLSLPHIIADPKKVAVIKYNPSIPSALVASFEQSHCSLIFVRTIE